MCPGHVIFLPPLNAGMVLVAMIFHNLNAFFSRFRELPFLPSEVSPLPLCVFFSIYSGWEIAFGAPLNARVFV